MTADTIIAILASLLLPSLARGKQKAQQIQCASNLKQLALAIHMYADDNRDTLPGPVYFQRLGLVQDAHILHVLEENGVADHARRRLH